jgi:uncharacterized protein YukE
MAAFLRGGAARDVTANSPHTQARGIRPVRPQEFVVSVLQIRYNNRGTGDGGLSPDTENLMGKANVDPAELRRFARDLTRFNSDLETLIGGLQSRMRELERTWADQEQKRFAQEFEQTVKTLARFLDASGQHAAFLAKKARHIEDYLQQR